MALFEVLECQEMKLTKYQFAALFRILPLSELLTRMTSQAGSNADNRSLGAAGGALGILIH